MSSLAKEQVQALLNASLALQENPSEKAFWLEKLDSLSEEGLQKLALILENEATQKAQIDQAHTQKTIANNEEYLESLKKIKTVILPQIEEHGDRSQENPDALLEQLKNV